MERAEKKDLITDRRRRQIQAAAMKVFSEKGFGKATIPDIAREAGIAVGTIYIYFQTKQEILLSILEGHVLVEPLAQFLEKARETRDQDLLALIFESCLKFGFDNVNQFIFLLGEILRDDYIRKMYGREAVKPAMRIVEDYLRIRMEEGAFSPSLDTGVAAHALVGMVIGLVLLYGIERDKGSKSRQWRRVAQELAHFVLSGLEERRDGAEIIGEREDLGEIRNGGVA